MSDTYPPNYPDSHDPTGPPSTEELLGETVSAATVDFEASVTLLAADALAFTKPLTELRRKVIVDALHEAARGGITEERETYWLDRMLSVGCTVTAPFREDGWVNDGFGI